MVVIKQGLKKSETNMFHLIKISNENRILIQNNRKVSSQLQLSGFGELQVAEVLWSLHGPILHLCRSQRSREKKRFSPKQRRQTIQIDLTTAVNVSSCLLTSFYSHTRFKCHLPARHLWKCKQLFWVLFCFSTWYSTTKRWVGQNRTITCVASPRLLI